MPDLRPILLEVSKAYRMLAAASAGSGYDPDDDVHLQSLRDCAGTLMGAARAILAQLPEPPRYSGDTIIDTILTVLSQQDSPVDVRTLREGVYILAPLTNEHTISANLSTAVRSGLVKKHKGDNGGRHSVYSITLPGRHQLARASKKSGK